MTIDRRDFMTAAAGASLAVLAGGTATSDAAQSSAGVQARTVELRHAFSVSIFFNERIRIASRIGRVFVPAIGGEIWGPRLQGRVLPYGGADYAAGGALDAHYMLEAADGTLIYICNRGYLKRLGGAAPSPAFARVPRTPGQPPDQRMPSNVGTDAPLRMRLTPTFDTPPGPHEWLSRTLFVGHGARYANPDHTIFTYYEVL